MSQAGRKSEPVSTSSNSPRPSVNNMDNGRHNIRGRKAKRVRRSTGGSSTNQTIHENNHEYDRSPAISDNHGSVSKTNFLKLTTDDKLSALYDIMLHVNGIAASVQRVEHTTHQNREHIDENTYRIKILEYKSIDNEARSRRNNVVIRGLNESMDEDCASKTLTFISDKLKLKADDFHIQRAHRLGKRVHGKTRPLIVCFRDYTSVTSIFQVAHRLSGSTVSVSRDYPQEITAARSKLWRPFKEAKQHNPRGTVKLIYPAKLVVNGRVTHDEFPDWNDVMSGQRLGPISYKQTLRNNPPIVSAPNPIDTRVYDVSTDSSTDDDTSDTAVFVASQQDNASQSLLAPTHPPPKSTVNQSKSNTSGTGPTNPGGPSAAIKGGTCSGNYSSSNLQSKK